jgi:hypothetical protein
VNTGDSPLTVDSEIIFPDGYAHNDDVLRFGAIYDCLKRDGRVNTKTGEPTILQMAVLTHAFRRVMRVPGIAGTVMAPLSALGRLRGYQSEFPEYEI